jgi:hypothetical protein
LAGPFDTLELKHDYIQWLFPLPEPSPVNPEAPTLTPEAVNGFGSDLALKARLRRALEKMLAFYGIAVDRHAGMLEVIPTEELEERQDV